MIFLDGRHNRYPCSEISEKLIVQPLVKMKFELGNVCVSDQSHALNWSLQGTVIPKGVIFLESTCRS